jgi:hypothetical protein
MVVSSRGLEIFPDHVSFDGVDQPIQEVFKFRRFTAAIATRNKPFSGALKDGRVVVCDPRTRQVRVGPAPDAANPEVIFLLSKDKTRVETIKVMNRDFLGAQTVLLKLRDDIGLLKSNPIVINEFSRIDKPIDQVLALAGLLAAIRENRDMVAPQLPQLPQPPEALADLDLDPNPDIPTPNFKNKNRVELERDVLREMADWRDRLSKRPDAKARDLARVENEEALRIYLLDPAHAADWALGDYVTYDSKKKQVIYWERPLAGGARKETYAIKLSPDGTKVSSFGQIGDSVAFPFNLDKLKRAGVVNKDFGAPS